MPKKKINRRRTRAKHAKPSVEQPQITQVNLADATGAGTQTDPEMGVRESMVAKMCDNARDDGIALGKRIERRRMVDGIIARIAFYEAVHMKPTTMTLSWYEVAALKDLLLHNGFGEKEAA